MQTILISVAVLGGVLALFALVAAGATFLRVTAGAQGLRGRIQRLFRLPERPHPRNAKHYYHAYWAAR